MEKALKNLVEKKIKEIPFDHAVDEVWCDIVNEKTKKSAEIYATLDSCIFFVYVFPYGKPSVDYVAYLYNDKVLFYKKTK